MQNTPWQISNRINSRKTFPIGDLSTINPNSKSPPNGHNPSALENKTLSCTISITLLTTLDPLFQATVSEDSTYARLAKVAGRPKVHFQTVI